MSFLGLFRRRRRPVVPIRLLEGGLAFPCEAVPTDVLILQAAEGSPIGDAIAIIALDSEAQTREAIIVSSATARAVAATLLNLADDLDGTTPLSFSEKAAP